MRVLLILLLCLPVNFGCSGENALDTAGVPDASHAFICDEKPSYWSFERYHETRDLQGRPILERQYAKIHALLPKQQKFALNDGEEEFFIQLPEEKTAFLKYVNENDFVGDAISNRSVIAAVAGS